MQVSIDVEDAVQAALNDLGRAACAVPVPVDLDQMLPLTCVRVLGGTRSSVVLDTFNIHFDTWADTPAEAVAESNLVAAALCDMQGAELGGVPCYRVTLASLPHADDDPDRPDLPRVTFMAQVTVRNIDT